MKYDDLVKNHSSYKNIKEKEKPSPRCKDMKTREIAGIKMIYQQPTVSFRYYFSKLFYINNIY